MKQSILILTLAAVAAACGPVKEYDLIIRNGIVYDGLGGAPFTADIAVNADTIAAIGKLGHSIALEEIDAAGLAVAPGFINMLSWANESLIEDGRSQSDIRQGITTEIMGEGWSEGPLNDSMKAEGKRLQGDIKFDISWTTLSEYLGFLEKKGISCNVASFIGATTVRIHEIGYENRPPTPAELERMKALVRQAMEEGAVGLASSLIYAPACFAHTEELIELARVAVEYDGLYISHLRSEGDQILQGLDELIEIAREAGIRAEIYHLKAAGRANWPKMDRVIAKIDSARATGLEIGANMYTYTAAATGLDASMPPWVQEGGAEAWVKRLKDPEIRKRLIREIAAPGKEWENFYDLAGSPENILLVGFKPDSLKKYTGKTLAELARIFGKDPVTALIDLVVYNGDNVGAIYSLMSEDNIRKQIRLPYVSFGSDAGSMAPEGVFLKSSVHPRTYGNVARLLGKYVRDEKIIPLEEAVRRLTSLPAGNLRLNKRGRLAAGYYADVVVFNPAAIKDKATFTNPHQYSEGMIHVFVNGKQVLKDGEHTGALPGRALRAGGRK